MDNSDNCIPISEDNPSYSLSGMLYSEGVHSKTIANICNAYIIEHFSKMKEITIDKINALFQNLDKELIINDISSYSGCCLSMSVHDKLAETMFMINIGGKTQTAVMNKDNQIVYQTKPHLNKAKMVCKFPSEGFQIVDDPMYGRVVRYDADTNQVRYNCGVRLEQTSILGYSKIKEKVNLLKITVDKIDVYPTSLSATSGFWDVVSLEDDYKKFRTLKRLLKHVFTMWNKKKWRVVDKNGLVQEEKHKIPQHYHLPICVVLRTNAR